MKVLYNRSLMSPDQVRLVRDAWAHDCTPSVNYTEVELNRIRVSVSIPQFVKTLVTTTAYYKTLVIQSEYHTFDIKDWFEDSPYNQRLIKTILAEEITTPSQLDLSMQDATAILDAYNQSLVSIDPGSFRLKIDIQKRGLMHILQVLRSTAHRTRKVNLTISFSACDDKIYAISTFENVSTQIACKGIMYNSGIVTTNIDDLLYILSQLPAHATLQIREEEGIVISHEGQLFTLPDVDRDEMLYVAHNNLSHIHAHTAATIRTQDVLDGIRAILPYYKILTGDERQEHPGLRVYVEKERMLLSCGLPGGLIVLEQETATTGRYQIYIKLSMCSALFAARTRLKDAIDVYWSGSDRVWIQSGVTSIMYSKHTTHTVFDKRRYVTCPCTVPSTLANIQHPVEVPREGLIQAIEELGVLWRRTQGKLLFSVCNNHMSIRPHSAAVVAMHKLPITHKLPGPFIFALHGAALLTRLYDMNDDTVIMSFSNTPNVFMGNSIVYRGMWVRVHEKGGDAYKFYARTAPTALGRHKRMPLEPEMLQKLLGQADIPSTWIDRLLKLKHTELIALGLVQ